MRQLRGSMERRWWIAVWRDCTNDGVGIVALPMGRIIPTTANPIPYDSVGSSTTIEASLTESFQLIISRTILDFV